MAGLLKYFCCESKQKQPVLPNWKGNLSEKVSELMNNIIQAWQEDNAMPAWEYLSLTSTQKLLIGKRAAEDEVTARVQCYSKSFSSWFAKFTNFFPYQYFTTYSTECDNL